MGYKYGKDALKESVEDLGAVIPTCETLPRSGSDVGQRVPAQDWGTLEVGLWEGWEQWHPGTWKRFKDAIREGWRRAVAPSSPRILGRRGL